MKPIVVAAIAILFARVAMADDSPAVKRSDEGEKKYSQACQRASDAFFKSMVAADKQAIDDLKIAKKIAKGDEAKAIDADLAAATKALEDDQASLDGHVPLKLHETPWQSKDQAAAATPAASQNEAPFANLPTPDVGMSEADADKLESDRGWAKVTLEKTEQGNVVAYQSGQVWSSGFQAKDLVLIKDGKVVKVKIIRTVLDDPAFAGRPLRKESGEVSGWTFYGGQ